MFAVLERVVAILLAQGPLGVVVLVQGWWIYKLHGQVSAVQEKRVQDAYKLVDSLSTCTSALDRNTDVLNALTKS